ncbi:rhodanese-like domain-containing protein [Methylosinus sp. LW4]|uniref:rhodanese-like domain-containing protein n=1 Tax=Methylosinus sp. LW4 TaxID=136993 RepID=UPI00037E6EE2|nr:rhodanese-like domain-containing protein [Methylosinus sp. LW4]
MVEQISARALRARWRAGDEVALFDAREEGPFSRAHPFFAVSLPFAEIEAKAYELAPRLSAKIVVYDDGEGVAERAARRLVDVGYRDVALLEGGLSAYREVGELFRDVNVVSKAFGELVESIRHTPSLSAREVDRLIRDGADAVVLDARRYEEYRTMSIPTAVSAPGAELALRIFDIAPSPDTLVIVNCAGRTRSIIGTQSLIDAAVPNRVAALRNGTIGWTLDGLALDRGQERRFPSISREAHARALAGTRARAARLGVATLDAAGFQAALAERDRRTLYLLDVRSPEEYAVGHASGFRSAPGGQLVQATDEWVAVRGAKIILYDDLEARALSTASWLTQLGWETAVLAPDAVAATDVGPSPRARPPIIVAPGSTISPEELAARRDHVVIVDLSRSPVYRAGHIRGAFWAAAAHLERDLSTLPRDEQVVLVSPDGETALDNLARAQSVARGAVALAGGTQAFGAVTAENPQWLSEPDDSYKRPYEGVDNSRDAMQAYIDWELQLVAQLANDGVANFHVVR